MGSQLPFISINNYHGIYCNMYTIKGTLITLGGHMQSAQIDQGMLGEILFLYQLQ